MKKTISPQSVQMGMRVLGFEGAWLKHPFWRSNFIIEDQEILQRVQDSSVDGVIVEMDESNAHQQPAAQMTAPPTAPTVAARGRFDAPRPVVNLRPIASRPARTETNSSSYNADLERAKTVVNKARKVMFRVFEQARLGKVVKPADVASLVDEISESVMRNPSAILNIARLKSKNEYTYMHSVAVCTLMLNMARILNLPETTYRSIGLAGLLHDIGKISIPTQILDKPGKLTDEEYELVKMHTINGRDLIADSADMPEVALDVCTHHHEKMDGTGYPFGHAAENLSQHARMGALCDVYDALTSNRVYKPGWAPQEALSAMRGWEGHFDNALFFQFLRSVGIFPTGMLVELRSQRLGLVLPNGRRNSRPKVRAFFDMRAKDFIPPEDVWLEDSMKHDQALREGDAKHWPMPNWVDVQSAILQGNDPRHLIDRVA